MPELILIQQFVCGNCGGLMFSDLNLEAPRPYVWHLCLNKKCKDPQKRVEYP